jgi:hypothetical protein
MATTQLPGSLGDPRDDHDLSQGIDGTEPPCTPEQSATHLAEVRATLAAAVPRIVVRIDPEKHDRLLQGDTGTCYGCGAWYGCDC